MSKKVGGFLGLVMLALGFFLGAKIGSQRLVEAVEENQRGIYASLVTCERTWTRIEGNFEQCMDERLELERQLNEP